MKVCASSWYRLIYLLILVSTAFSSPKIQPIYQTSEEVPGTCELLLTWFCQVCYRFGLEVSNHIQLVNSY